MTEEQRKRKNSYELIAEDIYGHNDIFLNGYGFLSVERYGERKGIMESRAFSGKHRHFEALAYASYGQYGLNYIASKLAVRELKNRGEL